MAVHRLGSSAAMVTCSYRCSRAAPSSSSEAHTASAFVGLAAVEMNRSGSPVNGVTANRTSPGAPTASAFASYRLGQPLARGTIDSLVDSTIVYCVGSAPSTTTTTCGLDACTDNTITSSPGLCSLRSKSTRLRVGVAVRRGHCDRQLGAQRPARREGVLVDVGGGVALRHKRVDGRIELQPSHRPPDGERGAVEVLGRDTNEPVAPALRHRQDGPGEEGWIGHRRPVGQVKSRALLVGPNEQHTPAVFPVAQRGEDQRVQVRVGALPVPLQDERPRDLARVGLDALALALHLHNQRRRQRDRPLERPGAQNPQAGRI
eukprot:scaffold843_cov108-Isochrysis_galbana.AAC.4